VTKVLGMTNKKYMKEPRFIKMCELANIEPTRRQASKFKNGKGRAYKKAIEMKGKIDG